MEEKTTANKRGAEVEKQNAVVDMLNGLKDQGYTLVGLTTDANMNGFVVIDNKAGEAVGTVVASEGEEVTVDWFEDEEEKR